jgi:uncharacterized protein RhaS with RHS repeats
MLLGHRYYDSGTGRFLTRDPIQDGRNWYTYAENNPTRYTDPEGYEYHDPTRVKVSRSFKGKVIAFGELAPDGPTLQVEVPPGTTTSKVMDVDYLKVIKPDGTTYVYFLPGVTRYLGSLGDTQTYIVMGNGTVNWWMTQSFNVFFNGWPPVRVDEDQSWSGPGDWPIDIGDLDKSNPVPDDLGPRKE